jgi:hypothetical protein
MTALGNPPCGTLGDYNAHVYTTAGKFAYVRTGIGNPCSIIGHVYTGDRLGLHCYTIDTSGRMWSYLDDFDSGATGWVLSSDLTRRASVLCFQ